MTPDIGLDALTALERDATPAPWEATALLTLDEFVVTGGPEAYAVGRSWTAADAVLIAAMRNTWPVLLSALTATRAELERKKRDDAQDTTIDERDEYHEVADKLAEAIAAVAGVDIGEHSNMNDPWANALEAMPKVAAELADAKREIHALTNSDDAQVVIAQGERDAARAEADALRGELETARAVALSNKRAHAVAFEECERLTAERARFIDRISAAVNVQVWTNEDGKRFVFADDLLAALDPEAAAVPQPDGPGHCGLCGSEDCPGVPGQGCTPGPFEPVEPKLKRRCAYEPGCEGTPLPFDLACDRHPACAECGGRIMHELTCRTARAERLAVTKARQAGAAAAERAKDAALAAVEAAGAGDGEQDTATTLPCHCPDGRRVSYCLVHGEKPAGNCGAWMRTVIHPAGHPTTFVCTAHEGKRHVNLLTGMSWADPVGASVQGAADGEAQA